MFELVGEFHRPRSISEAVRLLEAGGAGTRAVAGGTDLVVQADPGIRSLVDVTRLGLAYIRRDGRSWAIGATATMAEIERSRALAGFAGGILVRAAATCGSVQIRNMATLGGNLANGSPAADLATPLLVLEAVVVVAGRRKRRKIALQDFFSGPGKTALGKALLVEVRIPAPPGGSRTGWSFQKLGRTETDISLVNVACGLGIDAKGAVKWARIALGAVAPTPVRASRAENMLTGQKLERGLLQQAADELVREICPVSDVRASAEYRRQMSRVLARRALEECARGAGCSL